MNYRDVKRLVRIAAAGHLYSLEIFDEFPEEDEERVERAIREIQTEIRTQGHSRQQQAKAAAGQPEPGVAGG